MTAMRFFGGRAIDGYGRVAVLRASMAAAAAGLGLFVFAGNIWLAAVGAALWGVGAALAFPMGMSAAADDPKHAAARVSVVSTIGYVAFLAGPPLLGYLGDLTGIHLALLAIGCPILVALLLAGAAKPFRAGKRRAPPQRPRNPLAAGPLRRSGGRVGKCEECWEGARLGGRTGPETGARRVGLPGGTMTTSSAGSPPQRTRASSGSASPPWWPLVPGRTRRAAVHGLLAQGVASAVTNLGFKTLLPRTRPLPEHLPVFRFVNPQPTSSSMPSGHSASAVAFALGAGSCSRPWARRWRPSPPALRTPGCTPARTGPPMSFSVRRSVPAQPW